MADPETGECFPSYETLAKKAGMSRRKIIDEAEKLVKLGILEKIERKFKDVNASNIYRIRIIETENAGGGSAQCALGGAQYAPGGSAQCAPIEGKPIPLRKTNEDIELDFEEFYSAYPKKLNRKTALQRYQTARKNKISHDTIMRGLRGYLKLWKRENVEDKFKPAPDVWLNKEKYFDVLDVDTEASEETPEEMLDRAAKLLSK